MAAPQPKHMLGIEPKMYRHFAVLTLVITGFVGIFANGYQTQLADDQANPRGKAEKGNWKFWNSEGEAAEKAAKGNSTQAPASGGGDSGGGGGGGAETGPIDPAPAGGTIDAATLRNAPPVRVTIDEAALAALSPDQRAAYLRALAARRSATPAQPAAIATPAAPNQQQVDSLIAASRARSGGNNLDPNGGD